MMNLKNVAQKIKRFLKSEDGPTAVEYAVMLSLIIVICLGAVKSIGTNANATFSSVASQIAGPGA
jgi:pilus assembly protein Flp/PilA